jgi:RNA polymerase sigma-70 factor (ECF subfamily)
LSHSPHQALDFAAVYDEHVWKVYGFFAYRVGVRADAEDLTQQTFEKALRAWSRFDPARARPGTWLMAIARNLLTDHYRGDRSGLHEPLDLDSSRAPLAPPGFELGLAPELEQALSRLGSREREIIALRFGGEYSGPEIAAILGLSLANVQQIMSRSLRRLRADLEGSAGERSASGLSSEVSRAQSGG